MPRARNDFWLPEDEWGFDDLDDDADPDRWKCVGCGRIAPPEVTCQGPAPYPRPCPSGRRMPTVRGER